MNRSRRLPIAALGALFAACVFVVACQTRSSDASPSASAAASTTSTPGVPAPSAAAVRPWFSGSFTGQYEAKLAHVEVKVGALREWAADDGKLSTGPGTLTLKVDDAGLVEGASKGALGPSQASGKVEDDILRVSFLPNDPAALRGVLVATREGDGFKGTLQASSTDSSKVRSAAVELKKRVP